MKFLKYYINVDSLKQKIEFGERIKDIAFYNADISSDGEILELTCVVETMDGQDGEVDSNERYVINLLQ